MKKRLSVFCILFCLAFSALAFDFQAINNDGKTIYYNITSTSAVEVTNNANDIYEGVINIPDVVTNLGTTYYVRGIASGAFQNCTALTEVSMPSTMYNIGDNAFKGCTGLTDVAMGNSIINIAWSAFEGCTGLTSDTFSIPASVTTIGYSAFKDCTGLTTLVIPEGITKLENSTFHGCSGLNNVTLPSTLNEIKAHVFRNCTNLTLINFPETLTKIGVYAFSGCTNLMNVHLETSSVNYIDERAFEGCSKLTTIQFADNLSYIGEYAFHNCAELRFIEFPTSYTAVGARLFVNCVKLAEVILPSTTTSVGAEAFKDCERLGTLRCYAANPPAAGNNHCFDGILTNLTIYVPCSSVDAYMAQIPWNQHTVTCDPDISITTDVVPFDCGYVLGDGMFTTDETVTLIAIPREHYVFQKWTENDETLSTDSIYSFTATEDREIIAHFVHRNHRITASAEPSTYGRVTGGGVYEYSSVARLMAYPYEHYEFFYWTEHDSIVSTNTMYRFTVPYDRDLVAHFSPLSYNIRTVVSDTLAGTTTGDGVYVYNDTVTVSAAVNEHYNFVCWKEFGNVVSTDQDYTFLADRNRVLLAVYIPDEHTITASVNIPGAATIEGAGTYYYNSTATLIATGTQHYTFRTWSENSQTVSLDSLYSFVVTGDRDLVANFTLNHYVVTATTNIPGVGELTGEGTYLCGDLVTMTAQANLHASFVNWTENGNVVSTEPTFSFNIEGHRNLVANFNVEGNHHWTPNVTPYPHTMMLTAIIQIDGEEQYSDQLEVGAFCEDVVRGSQRAQLISSTGRYLVFMTIYGTNDETITFRLYDHSIGEELDLDCINTLTMLQDQIIGSTNSPYALNFISSLFVTAIASPEEGGTTIGGGPYEPGDTVYMDATPEPGYSFFNWTENDLIISTNAAFSFVITENRTLTANFVAGNHWTPDPGPYTNVMDITCVIEIQGQEQRSDMLEVGAFCGNVVRGSQRAEYVEEVDRYVAFMTLGGAAGEEITFRLYDHATGNESNYISSQSVTFIPNYVLGSVNEPYAINFVPAITIITIVNPEGTGTITGAGIYPYGSDVTLTAEGIGNYVFTEWTVSGNVVSTIPVYTFPATNSLVITASFEFGQRTDLSPEWNWFSTFVEMNGIDGLGMIKDNLIGKASIIKSKTEYIEYTNGEWNGTLTSVNNEQMYQIYMSEEYTLGIHGDIADPADHPITLIPEINWIGYPVSVSLDINDALAGLNPVEGDFIQSQECYAEYNDGIGWIGSLYTLEPGQGYMYSNSSGVEKTLIYQTGRNRDAKANRTTRDNFWQPNVHKYPNNMCITSSILLQNYEQNGDNFEIGAFCGDECRGSARPVYIPQLDKFVTYLTVYGNEGDEISFKLFDTDANEIISDVSENTISFSGCSILGSSTEAFEIEYNELLNVNENNIKISLYPNPAHQGDGVIISTNTDNAKMLIYNSLGLVIYEKTFNGKTTVNCFDKPGVYYIQVITDEGKAYRKVVID